MVDAGFLGTVTFAVGAGLATFFAPCAYPLLPGYVGYVLGDETGTASAAVRGVAASTGAVVVLAVVAGLVFTAGRRIAGSLVYFEPLVGVTLVCLGGLALTGRAPTLHLRLPERRATLAGCAVFGGGYALAAAGCVVPVLLGVLTQSLTLAPERAAVVLGGYAAATALPLTGVTLLSAVGSDALQSMGTRLGAIQRLAAVAMILAGGAQVVVSLRYIGVV